jgi:hypothetical protein
MPRAAPVRAPPPSASSPRSSCGAPSGRPALAPLAGLGAHTSRPAMSARSTAHAEGVDKTRALQRVLYRSAKQDAHRRFHALYDKVGRSDILYRAWGEMRSNRGAAGVDGVTIDAVVASGVEVFLDELAADLRAQTYRPAPLRRLYIPEPRKPGERRPLSIPTVRDRVAMTAAKLVLEPLFEAQFLPCSFGFRPRRSATTRWNRDRRAAVTERALRTTRTGSPDRPGPQDPTTTPTPPTQSPTPPTSESAGGTSARGGSTATVPPPQVARRHAGGLSR